jgi:hypothetical protein
MSNFSKIIILISFIILSIFGFMIKLPRVFHHYDKELHALFYFCTMFAFTLVYPKKWLIIAVSLFSFGILIEYAQELSNSFSIRLTGKKIHGKFDIQDIKYNSIGISFGILLFLITSVFYKSK